MKVSIAGAGQVGRSIARELIANGHQVLLVERDGTALKEDSVLGATWVHADACELSSLEDADLDTYDVAIAATGDDKTNLVHSLLAKTEFGVPRTVARVNHPGNEWLFDEHWGVDAAVSTPRLMAALVEEAVEAGNLVRLVSFQDGDTHLSEVTITNESGFVGRAVGEISLPDDVAVVALVRRSVPQVPRIDERLQAGDKLFFLTADSSTIDLEELFGGQGTDHALPGGQTPSGSTENSGL
ncbi:TrkA family potassium uptake protein [uncultured Tessaracoccus sp.]|uniref:potassium channel family protein n=1 Tax=uncultured Tessaracoccus sp. TaxID=905023 RepID=UPI0025F99FC8|nr:TrkA family potassium uptake protein [uncultured Tessaracoccus sp.]